MTPEELAEHHPRLYHLTAPGAIAGMFRHGLLPTSMLLDLFEVHGERRVAIMERPRPSEVRIEHSTRGQAVISDNTPLALRALAQCLDDGLGPSDWLRMLNERVFFWADEAGLRRLLDARINRDRLRDVLVLDTLSLARCFAAVMEVAPINTGATIRRAARRGLSTFAPLESHTYPEWRRLRGRQDRVLEVTVRGGIPAIGDHLIDVISVRGGSASWPAQPQGRRLDGKRAGQHDPAPSPTTLPSAPGGGTRRDDRKDPAAPSQDPARCDTAAASSASQQNGMPP